MKYALILASIVLLAWVVGKLLQPPITGLSGVTAIAAGGDHSLALKGDGTVWAWGDNSSGQLGDGTTTGPQACGTGVNGVNYPCSSTPVQVSGLMGVTAIAGGDQHSLALKSDGSVWAWGDNYNGELGTGTTTTSGCECISTPVKVSGLSGVTAIAAGGGYSLALKGDGTVWAWSNGMTRVSGLSGVTAIAAGRGFSLALKGDGTVWAWGDNTSGQLGNGSPASSSTPVEVYGLTGVTAIAGGADHSLALKSDGTVWAWGGNTQGYPRAGRDAVWTFGSTPVQVSGLSGVTAIAAGGGYSLALKGDGIVWAWGDNYHGQIVLDNGTTITSTPPVQVSGLTGVTAIAGGRSHSLALKGNGTVSAWGDNNSGQLGQPTWWP